MFSGHLWLTSYTAKLRKRSGSCHQSGRRRRDCSSPLLTERILSAHHIEQHGKRFFQQISLQIRERVGSDVVAQRLAVSYLAKLAFQPQ